jgi:hypothetical protein
MSRVYPRAQDRAARRLRLDKRNTACDHRAVTCLRHIARTALLPVVLAVVIACTQESRNNARFLGDCADPTMALVAPAVDAYVRSVVPRPRRFLIASGTDSALPGGSESRLQRHGPTYVFPADTTLRRRVLARLDSVAETYGDMPTLLVIFRGVDRAGDGHAVVRLGGYFLGGSSDGTVAHRTVQFVCDTARWNVVRAEEERRS